MTGTPSMATRFQATSAEPAQLVVGATEAVELHGVPYLTPDPHKQITSGQPHADVILGLIGGGTPVRYRVRNRRQLTYLAQVVETLTRQWDAGHAPGSEDPS